MHRKADYSSILRMRRGGTESQDIIGRLGSIPAQALASRVGY